MVNKKVPDSRCYSYTRFSTLEQRKGDSLRRQLELSDRYVREHHLTLDTSLTLEDQGLSAFKGQHRTVGALGQFLKLVKAKQIAPGSILLVESLDRLSREEITEALEQFLSLIRHGIKIVTLGDNNREYDKEKINANMGQLIVGIAIMARAHEESLTKSKRLRAVWEAKRKKIGEKKLTAKCPAWLQLSEDKTRFTAIPERENIIKRIFKLKSSGIGTESIARILNEEKNGWMPKNDWRKSYVFKILSNRSVLGEYQPHRIETIEDTEAQTTEWKRMPLGEPIKNYFPAIIPENLFYAVQPVGDRNFRGKNGTLSNLFGGLARCGYCNGPMRFVNKGKPPRGGKYLICDNAVRGRDCEKFSWRYEELEELVLTYCNTLKVGDLFKEGESKDSKIEALNSSLAFVQGTLSQLAFKKKNTVEQMTEADREDIRLTLKARLAEIIDNEKRHLQEEENLKSKIAKTASEEENTRNQINNIKKLLSFMRKESSDQQIDLRKQLRHRLRNLIEKIEVKPAGMLYRSISRMRPNKELRSMTVFMKGGSYKVLQPKTIPVLKQEYKHDEGRTYFPFVNGQGKMDVDVMPDIERKDKYTRQLKTIMTARSKRRIGSYEHHF